MIVSADNCPPLNGAAYWERSQDPYHVDAFPNEEAITGPGIATGIRASGWMAIGWHEDCLAFVADGSEYEDDGIDYIHFISFNGHEVRIPRDAPYLSELIQRHVSYIEAKAKAKPRSVLCLLRSIFYPVRN